MVAITVTLIASVVGPLVVGVHAARLKRAVGTPNGRGDIVQMLERIDARTERLETRTADLVDSQAGQDRRLAAIERTVWGPPRTS